ncbi:sulfatase [bacterium]|nr:sulfatase [candidate division CSSED10-310 bacterium]
MVRTGRRPLFWFAFLLLLLVPLLLLHVQLVRLNRAVQAKRYPYVLLITIDTLRADRLGCYGNCAIKTPIIDRLVRDSVQFENFYSQIPITNPSHCSIFTGLLPSNHGVLTNGVALAGHFTTLTQRFQEMEYRTAAFISGFSLVKRISGLHHHFDLYDDEWSGTRVERGGKETTRAALNWLRRLKDNPRERFFLWVHYFDPHQPYEPGYPYDEMYLQKDFVRPPAGAGEVKAENYKANAANAKLAGFFHVVVKDTMTTSATPDQVRWNLGKYDGEISAVDREVGRLLRELAQLGILDETLIMLLSDHGEGFDHDYFFTHGDRLYDSSVRIPAILHLPYEPARLTAAPAETVDILPTMYELFNYMGEGGRDGRSFLNEISGGPAAIPADIFAMTPGLNRAEMSLGPLISIRTSQWKMIMHETSGETQLYSMDDDPAELVDKRQAKPRIAADLAGRLRRFMADRPELSGAEPVNLDEEVTARLREMGYIK